MPILQHTSGRWSATAPAAQEGVEPRHLAVTWSGDEELVALEVDERSGLIEVGTWRAVLSAMEKQGVVECEIKGHTLLRVLPGPAEDGVGRWDLAAKAGVSQFYRWPQFSGGAWSSD